MGIKAHKCPHCGDRSSTRDDLERHIQHWHISPPRQPPRAELGAFYLNHEDRMRIAPHHIKGTPQNAISAALGREPEYTPVCEWPDDCMVQWGNGIIPRTPFFEAFPPGTFIRGEGETIEVAERKAYAQYVSEFLCAHAWGRQGKRGLYLNGAGWCRKCDAFRGSMFREVVRLGHWRKPLRRWERDHLISVETNDDGMNEWMDAKHPEKVADRKRYAKLLRLRLNLFGVDEESSRIGLFDRD